jgi:hypothetical protein
VENRCEVSLDGGVTWPGFLVFGGSTPMKENDLNHKEVIIDDDGNPTLVARPIRSPRSGERLPDPKNGMRRIRVTLVNRTRFRAAVEFEYHFEGMP